MSESTPTATVSNEAPAPEKFPTRVFLTGATGFVGRAVLRELIAKGHQVVCLARDRQRLGKILSEAPAGRIETVKGDLFDSAVADGVKGADAVVHLVGIIVESKLRGQTFRRVHVEGTQRVIEAAQAAGVKRYVHMSALGTRPNAVSEYHRTKWAAENIVRASGLDWTIFRPSLIHGPGGEFMNMMKTFVCDAAVPVLGFIPAPFPVIPYFGSGEAKLQPVSVKDVAHCFAAAVSSPETIGKVLELGGPQTCTWKEFYKICQELIPCAKPWKRLAGVPVPVAKVLAHTFMRLPLLPKALRYDVGQVIMSQEDSVCDARPAEEAFGIKMRDFRTELAAYAEQIGQ
ncbi:MAG TPA: complex I NDUFA9 subunit family protein [Phycisphaerae bacterium]|nr:complex I NDUFA9 subunit family protein [Phycisphaerae bacterium]